MERLDATLRAAILEEAAKVYPKRSKHRNGVNPANALFCAVDFDGEVHVYSAPPLTNHLYVHVSGMSVGYVWGKGRNTATVLPGVYAL